MMCESLHGRQWQTNTNCISINTDLITQQSFGPNNFLENVFADMGVDGTEGIIQHVDIGVVIDGPRQAHSLLLSAAQIYALRNKTQ